MMETVMKKFFLILLLFLISCSAVSQYDAEFKNPAFNQLLSPLGKTVGYAYLTPSSIKLSKLDNKDKIDYIGKCGLVENKQDRITLKCAGEWDNGSKSNSYFTYVITDLLSSTCLIIEQYDYSTPKEFPKQASYGTYCITPPNDTNSESD